MSLLSHLMREKKRERKSGRFGVVSELCYLPQEDIKGEKIFWRERVISLPLSLSLSMMNFLRPRVQDHELRESDSGKQ